MFIYIFPFPISADANVGTMHQTAFKKIKRKYENLRRIKFTKTKKKLLKKMRQDEENKYGEINKWIDTFTELQCPADKENTPITMRQDDENSYDEVNTQWTNTIRQLQNTENTPITVTDTTEEIQLGELCQSLKELIGKLNQGRNLLDNLADNSIDETHLIQLFITLTPDIRRDKLIELKRILTVWQSLSYEEFWTEFAEITSTN